MTIHVTTRRLVALVAAIAVAWPVSLWAVGYNAAVFVRNANLRTCELRGTPQLLVNSGAWETASTVRKATDTPGSLPAGDYYGESADLLARLAAIPCTELNPKPPLFPGLEGTPKPRPPVKVPVALTPTPSPTPSR